MQVSGDRPAFDIRTVEGLPEDQILIVSPDVIESVLKGDPGDDPPITMREAAERIVARHGAVCIKLT